MARDVIKICDINDEYTYIEVPFPPKFTIENGPLIVNETMAMSGEPIGEVIGRKRSDATLTWPSLEPDVYSDLARFLSFRYEVLLRYPDYMAPGTTGGRAWVRGLSSSRMRYKNGGKFVCEDIQLKLSFPDVYSY